MISSQELSKFCDEVSRFWNGAHLYLQILDEDTIPSMDWYTIRLPRKHLSDPVNAVRTTLYHEWGHRAISPGSPEKLKIWQLLVLESLKNNTFEPSADSGRIVVNMITDLWIDSFYLSNPKTSAFYLEGIKFGTEQAGRNLKAALSRFKNNSKDFRYNVDSVKNFQLLFNIFLSLYDKLIADKQNQQYTFNNKTAEQAFRIIFDAKASEEARLIRFARLISLMLHNIPEVSTYLVVTGEPFTTLNENYPIDRNKIINAVRKYGITPNGRNFKSVFGTKSGIDLYAQLKSLQLYSEVINVVDNIHRKSIAKKQFVGYSRWRVGQKLNELQLERSIERSGMIVPNFTTLKKNYLRVGHSSNNSGTANICLIADDSGSMIYQNRLNLLQEALFSVILSAEKRGDSVSLLIFGSEISYEQKPTTDYELLKKIVASMDGYSGGTIMTAPVKKAAEIAAQVEKQTTFIFSDSYVFESKSEMETELKKLGALSRIIVFAFSDNISDAQVFKDYFPYDFENKFYYIPSSTHFYESALEELYA